MAGYVWGLGMTPIIRGETPDGREAWLVRGHEQVTALLADNRMTMQPPSTQVSSWFADSPMHRVLLRLADRAIPDGETDREERARRRVTMTKMFKRGNIHRTLPDVKGFAEELIDQMIAAGPPANLGESFSTPLCAKVVCDLLGVPDSDIPLFRQWADDKYSRDFKVAAIALRQLSNYVKNLMEARRENPGDDIVSTLLAAEGTDEMHTGRTANLVIWILGLGWQVSAAAIDLGTMLLLTHPEQRKMLESDPSLMPTAVEEVLRHFNPTPRDIGGADRYPEQDFEYDGVQFKQGDMVVLDIARANHDPDVFTEPDGFDITRDPNPHLTFGHGFYYCNFNQVARTEVAVGLEAILRRFPSLRLAVPPDEIKFLHYPPTGPAELPLAW
jgi:cytochrome P450